MDFTHPSRAMQLLDSKEFQCYCWRTGKQIAIFQDKWYPLIYKIAQSCDSEVMTTSKSAHYGCSVPLLTIRISLQSKVCAQFETCETIACPLDDFHLKSIEEILLWWETFSENAIFIQLCERTGSKNKLLLINWWNLRKRYVLGLWYVYYIITASDMIHFG